MAGTATAARNTLDADQRKWLERFARFGYAAKGFVYVLVGLYALSAAFGGGGGATDSSGALAGLLNKPYGKTLLLLTALGLLGYATWRFLQAIKDADGEGTDAKGIAKRAMYALSGVIHIGLALEAVRLSRGTSGGGSGDSKAQDWTAWLMSQPFGRWLAIAAGVGIVVFGLMEFYRAYKLQFMKRIRRENMSESTLNGVRTVGRMGLAARGVVFLIIGSFVALAAIRSNPEEAMGMGGALRTLQEQPYGLVLIGIVGAGLLAYGIFQFVNARYRTINPPEIV